MSREESLSLLKTSPIIHLATSDASGEPMLRTLSDVAVFGDYAIYFQAGVAGEAFEGLGRPAVLSADELVAEMPHTVTALAPQATGTTFFRSAQVRGRIELVKDPKLKSQVFDTLARASGSRGGYAPIVSASADYHRMLRDSVIMRVPFDRVEGEADLGQGRAPTQLAAILNALWQRGRRGDCRAIDMIVAANPGVAKPDFLEAPAGIAVCCGLADNATASDLDGTAYLLIDKPWNFGCTDWQIRANQRNSIAWVGARDEVGRIVGTARASGDGITCAHISDVAVASEWRERRVGSSLMRVLLAHPALRGCPRVTLITQDAQVFCRPFGFVETVPQPAGVPTGYTEMTLLRRAL